MNKFDQELKQVRSLFFSLYFIWARDEEIVKAIRQKFSGWNVTQDEDGWLAFTFRFNGRCYSSSVWSI